MNAQYCTLPLLDKRRAYVPADHTNVAETWRQHEPIRVSPAYGDDYDMVERSSHLDMIGEFK